LDSTKPKEQEDATLHICRIVLRRQR